MSMATMQMEKPTAPKPSPRQLAIYAEAEQGQGDLFIDAVAGSGKTTSLKALSELLKGSVLFLAFSTLIVAELKTKLPSYVTVSGIHGWALKAVVRRLGKVQVDGNKYRLLIREHLANSGVFDKDNEVTKALLEVIGFVQSQLIDPKDMGKIQETINHFGVELPDPQRFEGVTATWMTPCGAASTRPFYSPSPRQSRHGVTCNEK
jgi:hypothetical protein